MNLEMDISCSNDKSTKVDNNLTRQKKRIEVSFHRLMNEIDSLNNRINLENNEETIKELIYLKNLYEIDLQNFQIEFNDFFQQNLISKVEPVIEIKKPRKPSKVKSLGKGRKKLSVYKIDPRSGNIVGKYDSITEGGKTVNLKSFSHISGSCKGKEGICKGYIWRYANHSNQLSLHEPDICEKKL